MVPVNGWLRPTAGDHSCTAKLAVLLSKLAPPVIVLPGPPAIGRSLQSAGNCVG
jgi:hypothetical protein